VTAEVLGLAGKGRLALEIGKDFVRVRRTLRAGGLKAALVAARPGPGRVAVLELGSGGEADWGTAFRLARAVDRTLALLPGDTRCLTRSLVLSSLLSRRGTTGSIVIGVRPGESFGAHAWVELDGRPLQPPGGTTYPRLVEL
jgi:hypothetical protein